MMNKYVCSLMVLVSGVALGQEDVTKPQLKTASSHSMQYYVSLPHGWTAGKKYPVVVTIEDAHKEFEQNAEAFARARGQLPFILVTPLVITNGGGSYREVPTYHYTDAVWNEVERAGRCQFDLDGIAAIVRDVQKLYGGEDKYFLTGWEAGAHIVWALVFQHPEALQAVAPSGPNYNGRCMEDGRFSVDPARGALPVNVFLSEGDVADTGGFIHRQSDAAIKLAQEHGYRVVSKTAVKGKPRGPLPEEVLAYFLSLRKH